jgi:hypothetical protein
MMLAESGRFPVASTAIVGPTVRTTAVAPIGFGEGEE